MTHASVREGVSTAAQKLPVAQATWWSQNNGTGSVDPRCLAPDPDQPRKSMSPQAFEELFVSIKDRGVREAITVTPRHLAPWARVDPAHEDAFFLIVSGHRRWNGANRAALRSVPIRVVIYASEVEHREDAALLNANRDEMSELDVGFELVRLRTLGRSIEQLLATFGGNANTLYNRINLTRLHPDIQTFLTPDKNGKRKLPIVTAGILGGTKTPTRSELEHLINRFREDVPKSTRDAFFDSDEHSEDELRFTMQHVLIAVVFAKKLNSVRAAEFIREQTLVFSAYDRMHATHRTERYQPRRRKDILETLCRTVTDSAIVDWNPQEWRRIFELATREEVEERLAQLANARDVFVGLHKILSGIRDAKSPTRSEVLKLVSQRRK